MCVCLMFNVGSAYADSLSLDDALRATYTACVDIDDELTDLKKMAGINTAITAVATATGAGATVVGLVKSNKDAQIENLERKLEKLHEIEKHRSFEVPNKAELLGALDAYYEENKDESKQIEDEIEHLTQQSKKLGNLRTGLLGTGTVANTAGTIMANNNKIKKDLKTQIKECRESLNRLDDAIGQARLDGTDTTRAKEIATACSGWKTVDISVINHRANGAAISSVIGAGTGMFGTITSAVANTNKTRQDNTDSGKQKEKNLNTASNVLSGATTIASGTATVFNATQISTIKKVASVAEKCTGALK